MRVVASSLFAFRQQELRRKQHHRRHQQQHHARERKRRRNRCAIASTLATKTTESPPLEYYEHTKIPSTEFTETCHGPEEYTSVLLHAMRMQWKHGFTHVPNGFRRVTHGFGEILAGMQPAAAERCVELLLRRGEAEDDDHENSKTREQRKRFGPVLWRRNSTGRGDDERFNRVRDGCQSVGATRLRPPRLGAGKRGRGRDVVERTDEED